MKPEYEEVANLVLLHDCSTISGEQKLQIRVELQAKQEVINQMSKEDSGPCSNYAERANKILSLHKKQIK